MAVNRTDRPRPLRVVIYALVIGTGQRPDADWDTAEAEAALRGYAIHARLHDVATPAQRRTDAPAGPVGRLCAYTPPGQRPGWSEVRRQIQGGYAEGVVVVTRHDVSSDPAEYAAEIQHLGHQHQAFVHVVTHEAQDDAPT
ncbi:hypothetical protein [Streptomyces sp. MI02-7b]|uniref:hypothetical protein n=1 Tax=Streptomyces sp. MI02-7b TaxID=462941 RepID=UPI0029A582E7|nr:hypothetical protein [Streptomyces sp. MI02-7b]MDX3075829.1 hypothetical protein [Streptomyces sp. MI02-7b]